MLFEETAEIDCWHRLLRCGLPGLLRNAKVAVLVDCTRQPRRGIHHLYLVGISYAIVVRGLAKRGGFLIEHDMDATSVPFAATRSIDPNNVDTDDSLL